MKYVVLLYIFSIKVECVCDIDDIDIKP